tara:strand:+ start:106 stop:1002 length:897 start_codon:yes stop_codon:yes gene_type:complete
MRNNEDRTGERRAAAGDPTPALAAQVEAETSTSKSLDFACPTEFVELPSQGKFYANDHPLKDIDSVEIRFMTAKDEDVLTSKSLLKKGVAIDRFLQNILVDQKVKVQDLLIGDKNALVVASRITGYGADYQTKVACPSCGTSQDYEFDLETSVVNAGGIEAVSASLPAIAGTMVATDDNTWVVECPKSRVAVEVQLMTGHHEKFLAKSAAMKKKQKLPETMLTDQLRQTIVSVNGSKEPKDINRFIDVMPAMDSRFLRSLYDKLMPNVDLTQQFDCHSCGFEQEMEVPFTTDFFWPKR